MQVIDQINGSALFAQSAFSAGMASKDNLGRNITATYLTGINIPGSANWEEATTAYQTNSASYITSLSSPLGTIEISGNQIESTNSGIKRITYPPIQPESISSNRSDIAPSSDAIFTKTLISTTVMAPNAELWLKVEGGYFYGGEKILYSGSNGSSGEFDLRTHMEYGLGFITASIPNEQLLYVYDSRQWVGFSPEQSFVSGDEMEQVKCERLAWASEVGGGFPVSADEAIQYVENNSATINDVNTSYQTNSGTYLTDVDLTPYATTNDLEQVSGDITALIQTYTSPKGTILVNGNTLEGTNSAVETTVETVDLNSTTQGDFSAIPGYPFDSYSAERTGQGSDLYVRYGELDGDGITVHVLTANTVEIPLTSGGYDLGLYYGQGVRISAVKSNVVELALKSELPTSSQLLPYPMAFVSTSSEATGANILYVVTGTGV